jgi:thiamine-phosphate diphosphorylase
MRSEDRQKDSDSLRLYLILEESLLKVPLDEFIPAVIEGGVTAVQLRNKGFSVEHNLRTGQKVMALIEGKGILFVVNDRIDLAIALGAEAVHLGVKDIPLAAAVRTWAGMVYGYSCNSTADLKTAVEGGASYIGTGPAFYTGTKKDLRPVISPEGIRAIAEESPLPAVAVGGINSGNILELKNCGLAGVAVSSALCGSADPYIDAKKLRELAEAL